MNHPPFFSSFTKTYTHQHIQLHTCTGRRSLFSEKMDAAARFIAFTLPPQDDHRRRALATSLSLSDTHTHTHIVKSSSKFLQIDKEIEVSSVFLHNHPSFLRKDAFSEDGVKDKMVVAKKVLQGSAPPSCVRR
ncbi:uncharacterized protein LOC130989684 [Salvia miltiorrhiza]|uniref:uncharacterized protein LOC130989684 n=1 Tax=Salvia miltiorrhiza TaxID=226208 RepID=UPI0025ACB16A|nr:uncharacterized protein LOC130989684 [Salvia miltiorrhiza]